jgi:hypothetical protein
VSGVLEGAYEFPEGRWLFIKIESEEDLNDIRQLLMLRAEQTEPLRHNSTLYPQ